jgi:tetratricopeptide (TPR) repeat protein
MNSFKYILTSLGLGLLSIIAFSSNPPSIFDQRLYHCYQSGNMREWVIVISELEIQNSQRPSTETLFSIAQAQYGYIGYLIGIGDSKKAREIISKAEKNVEKILSSQPNNADAMAIKASLLIFQISISPFKAPFLGPRSMSMIDEAYKKNDKSPQAILEKANALHYAPAFVGGNPLEAVKYYTRAIIAFENQNNGNPPQLWLYLNTLAQLALAYEKSNQPLKAKHTYNEILSIAPDFKWVKDELYPAFEERKK